MKQDKIILPENVELEKVTIEVFRDKSRPEVDKQKYWLSEDNARSELATHEKCDGCGEIKEKRGYCSPCASKRSKDNYLKKQFKEWDGETPVVIYNSDECFFDAESIDEYMENNDVLPEELSLVICSPNHFGEISEDYWSDIIPENWDGIEDGNKAVSEKLKEFNEFLHTQPPFSWSEGIYRTTYNPIHNK